MPLSAAALSSALSASGLDGLGRGASEVVIYRSEFRRSHEVGLFQAQLLVKFTSTLTTAASLSEDTPG